MSSSRTIEFSLGSILSVVQRRMLSPSGPHEFYSLVLHVLHGPDVAPGYYPINDQAIDRCAAELVRQHEWLERVPRRPGADFHTASIRDWAQLDLLEQRLGARHPVVTMADGKTE